MAHFALLWMCDARGRRAYGHLFSLQPTTVAKSRRYCSDCPFPLFSFTSERFTPARLAELRARYAEVFGETTQVGHRTWLTKRGPECRPA
jgi:hypothetical protein